MLHHTTLQVEQVGELKILWIRRAYSTWLTVTEDSRDPECLVTIFELLRSVSLHSLLLDLPAQKKGGKTRRPPLPCETHCCAACGTLSTHLKYN